MIVSDILKDAMGLIGAVEIDETPTATEIQTAMRVANMMLGRWSTQRLTIRSPSKLTIPLVSGKATYTIGPDGTYDIIGQRPISIISAYLRDQNNHDTPLDIITKSLYNTYPDKEISSGIPSCLVYDPLSSQQNIHSGEITVYNTPSSTYTIYAEAIYYITEFTNVNDDLTFEPGYYEALVYGLAARLFRYYHPITVALPQDIAIIASSSLSNIKAMNSVRIISAMDIPGVSGDYNIYTDK